MPQILNYNIHNILKFQIVRKRGRGIKDLLNLKFSYFEVEDVENPDIILNIGEFKPSNNNCYTVDHKYHIKENYFYCKDSEGSVKWEVEIINFEYGNTIINFDGKVSSSPFFLYPDFVAQNFLLRFIEYKLNNKGYLFAHGASISKNGNACVFAGRGGSFKTSLCMDLIRKRGFDFLGDDRVILHKNKVFSFPMGLPVFNFMCKYLPFEESWNLNYKLKFAKYLILNRSIQNTKSDNVIEFSNIRNILFIVRTNKSEVTKKKLSFDQALDKLIINNRLEDFVSLSSMGIKMGPHLKYEFAYSYLFPDSLVAAQNNIHNLIKEIIVDRLVYELEIPYEYSLSSYEEICKVIEYFE